MSFNSDSSINMDSLANLRLFIQDNKKQAEKKPKKNKF